MFLLQIENEAVNFYEGMKKKRIKQNGKWWKIDGLIDLEADCDFCHSSSSVVLSDEHEEVNIEKDIFFFMPIFSRLFY